MDRFDYGNNKVRPGYIRCYPHRNNKAFTRGFIDVPHTETVIRLPVGMAVENLYIKRSSNGNYIACEDINAEVL